MKILAIRKRTKKQDKELKRLQSKSGLTKKEAGREVFLSVKDLWNCEC